MENRVAIFIDGSNLYHALRDNYSRVDLNFTDFTGKLCAGRPLFRTYYYNVLQDPSQRPEGFREQQEFLDVLKKTPYLATDLLHFAWNDLYDVAILVSGDGDFAYALQAAKNMGKHVEVAYFESNISKSMLDVADNRHLLNQEFFKGLWRAGMKRRPRRGRKGPRRTDRVAESSAGSSAANSLSAEI
jgi:uncharacterized LabA/DUF88 family protein